MASEVGKAKINEAVRIRRDTDRVMSAAWILTPLLGFLVFLVILVITASFGVLVAANGVPEAAVGAAATGLFVGVIAYVVLAVLPWYRLIDRRNKHFRRDRLLREGILTYLMEEAARRGEEARLTTELATMRTIHSESNAEEDEKSAVLWVIVTIITFGIAGIYVLYFLTKDPQKHDARQQAFFQMAQSAISKLGKTVVVPTWKTLPSRSFFLYLVLQILTGGIFGLYWYYVLIKDFNEHFKAQWQYEDQLIAAL